MTDLSLMNANRLSRLSFAAAFAFVTPLLGLMFLFIAPLVAYASTAEEAQTEVRQTIDRVKSTVAQGKSSLSPEALDGKLRDILMPVFDFDEMARASLGANWKKGTPEEQNEFVKLFSNLLARTYLSKIRKNVESSEVDFLNPMTKDDRVVVRSVIKADGSDIAADYRMYKKDGKWRVYDVIIENVGLVTNYRNEFASILRKENFAGLIEKLRTRVNNQPTA